MNKVVIFDFDGVIVDSTGIAAQDLMDRYPKLTLEISKQILDGNFHAELKKFKQGHGYSDLIGEEAERHRKAYLEKKMKALLFPNIKTVIEKLKSDGCTIVLNTSAWERNVLPLLEKYELSKLFDFIATAELSKDKIEKFRLIRQRYGGKITHLLFITDTLGDLKESQAAGVDTICVTWGAHDRERFLQEPHKNLIGIVDTAKELLQTISNYFNSVTES